MSSQGSADSDHSGRGHKSPAPSVGTSCQCGVQSDAIKGWLAIAGQVYFYWDSTCTGPSALGPDSARGPSVTSSERTLHQTPPKSPPIHPRLPSPLTPHACLATQTKGGHRRTGLTGSFWVQWIYFFLGLGGAVLCKQTKTSSSVCWSFNFSQLLELSFINHLALISL